MLPGEVLAYAKLDAGQTPYSHGHLLAVLIQKGAASGEGGWRRLAPEPELTPSLALPCICAFGRSCGTIGEEIRGTPGTVQMDLAVAAPGSIAAVSRHSINAQNGGGALRVASTGLAQSWSAEGQRLSQGYTTRWEDIVQIDNRRV